MIIKSDGQACNSKAEKVKEVKSQLNSTDHRRKSVGYPAILPPLTANLQKLKEEDKVYENQADFISFWSSYLEVITDGHPTKADYFNYCKTIIETFPEMKGGQKSDFVSIIFIYVLRIY